MTRVNIDATRKSLEQRAEVEQLTVDGDTSTEEAVFRALVDSDDARDFERFVEEELPVEVTKSKWVVFGQEVVIR